MARVGKSAYQETVIAALQEHTAAHIDRSGLYLL